MTTPLIVNAAAGAGTPAAPGSSGLKFTIPFPAATPSVGGAPATAQLRARNSAQVLAIAAAAAAKDPGESVLLARQMKEKPDEVLAQAFDDDRVRAILREVEAAQDDPSKEFEITPQHRAIASAVGANPRLVAAAAAAIGDHDEDARLWAVRIVDAGVLDRAARAAARTKALDALDTGATGSVNARVQALEKDLKDTKAALAALDARVRALEPVAST